MDEFLVRQTDGVATVTINRPEQRNAINYAMWHALPELCARLDADRDVRVVIWTGAGDAAFSAGGDISEFVEHRSNAAQTRVYNEVVAQALDAVLALSKPTIALVKGYCVGGGFILAAYCDLRIAAENAQFGLPVARLGMPVALEATLCNGLGIVYEQRGEPESARAELRAVPVAGRRWRHGLSRRAGQFLHAADGP